MSIEQQIAKDLRDSGLFDEFPKGPVCELGSDGFPLMLPWPDVDTMWSIISKMGWQVVWMDTEDEWQLGCFEDDFFNADVFAIWVNARCPIYAAKGQLTLANNEAMAWISKKPECRPKLEAAINKVRGNHDKQL